MSKLSFGVLTSRARECQTADEVAPIGPVTRTGWTFRSQLRDFHETSTMGRHILRALLKRALVRIEELEGSGGRRSEIEDGRSKTRKEKQK